VHPKNSVDSAFLLNLYPRLHMALYKAISGVEENRQRIPKAIEFVLAGGEPARLALEREYEQETNKLTRRALRIITYLSRSGYDYLLRQVAEEQAQPPLDIPLRGVVIQLTGSERWERRYGTTAFDVVVAVPSLARVIALSTTEVEGLREKLNYQFEQIQMQNFHLYSSFNRAHAVRGREAGIFGTTFETKPIEARSLWFLLRTSMDARRIAASQMLRCFTPIGTLEGLRLGFYFGTVCKVTDVSLVKSPTGFGWNYAQNDVTAEDQSGPFQFRLNTEVFRQSLELSELAGSRPDLRDALELGSFPGSIFVLACWFMGDDVPQATSVSFLKDDSASKAYSTLAYMNSRRRVSREHFTQLVEPLGGLTRELSSATFESGEWVYYLEDEWSANTLLCGVANQMRPLSFSETLRLHIDRREYLHWLQETQLLFGLNPQLLSFYTSIDADKTFDAMYSPPIVSVTSARETSAAENQELIGDLALEPHKLETHDRRLTKGPPLRPVAVDVPHISLQDEGLARFAVESFLGTLSLGPAEFERLGNALVIRVHVPNSFQKKGLLAALILNELEIKVPDLPHASVNLQIV